MNILNGTVVVNSTGLTEIKIVQEVISSNNPDLFKLGLEAGESAALVVSNLFGDYYPSGLMGAVKKDYGIGVQDLLREIQYNADSDDGASSVWVSFELKNGQNTAPQGAEPAFSRLIVIEKPSGKINWNNQAQLKTFMKGCVRQILALVAAVNAKNPGNRLVRIVMTAPGTGDFGLPPAMVFEAVFEGIKETALPGNSFRELFLVESDGTKAQVMEQAMRKVLENRALYLQGLSLKLLELQTLRIREELCSPRFIGMEMGDLDDLIKRCVAKTIGEIERGELDSAKIECRLVSEWCLACRKLMDLVEQRWKDKITKPQKKAYDRFVKCLQDLGGAQNGADKVGENMAPPSSYEAPNKFINQLAFFLIQHQGSVPWKPEKWEVRLVQALHIVRAYGNLAAHLEKQDVLPKGFQDGDILLLQHAFYLVLENVGLEMGAPAT